MSSKWMVLSMLVLAMAAGKVKAGEAVSQDPALQKITDPAEFRTMVAELDRQMQAGGRYQFVRPLERQRVEADLDRIQQLLEKRAAGSTLNTEDLAQQLTAQTDLRRQANVILHQRDGERLVCERVKPIGSNVPVTSCVSYAEKEKQRAGGVEFLRNTQDRNPQTIH